MVTENILFLPGEILCMILSWLEAKCLLRCASVCKVWNAVLFENIPLIDMHAIQNGCRSDHIISHKRMRPTIRRIDTDDDDVNLDRAEEKKKYKFLSFISCRGLLVAGYISRAWIMPEKKNRYHRIFYNPTTKYCSMPATKYRICNFTTKRVLDLPCPHEGVIIMRVFLNSSTSSYHVVSLYNDKENKVKFQVIDLGGHSNDPCPNYKDLSWRTLDIPEYDVANRLQEYDCMSCVLEEGIVFIPAFLRKVVSSNLPMILCVDLVQQACTTLNAPPESLRFENRKVNFQLWRGKPALSLVSEDQKVLYVWIVEDYKTQKWADPILIPLPCLDENSLLRKQIPQIYQGDEEDFLVYNEYYKFNVTIVIGYHVCKIGSEVLSYEETPRPTRVPTTLVSVKGMRRKNKKAKR